LPAQSEGGSSADALSGVFVYFLIIARLIDLRSYHVRPDRLVVEGEEEKRERE